MCGIAGYFNKHTNTHLLKEAAASLSSRLSHRGPDDAGIVFLSKSNNQITRSYNTDTAVSSVEHIITNEDYIHIDELKEDIFGFLLHRRLSIIDLSFGGHQPMISSDKRYVINFNGEIYNYKEIKKELLNEGIKFHTESDTEVLLKAMILWGVNALDKLNGMWAFAFFDTITNELMLCRDRLGVKPLYFSTINETFSFASEQKAFLALPESNYYSVNEAAIFDLFTVGRIESGQEDFFKNIHELKPGHYLKYNFGSMQVEQIRKWYEPEKIRISDENYLNLKSKLFETFKTAVSLRMRADVEVGTCLSGGIDSSSICMMMHVLNSGNNEHLNAYTAVFEGSAINEQMHAQKVINACKANWHTIQPDEQGLLGDFETLTYCQDIPLWSSSTYAQFKVMEKVKQSGIKVVLDGQGGDELFAGYHSHRITYALELLSQFKPIKSHKIQEGRWGETLRFASKYWVQKYGSPSLLLKTQKQYTKGLQFLQPDFLEAHKDRLKLLEPLAAFDLKKRLDEESYNRNLKSYLITEDRCSMWHSVESRTPFADDIDLINLARAIPSDYLIDNVYGKKIFRDAVQTILPQEIYNRKDKLGFQTPNNEWLNNIADNLKPLLLSYLPGNIFNLPLIEKQFDTYFKPQHQLEDASIFKFYSLAMWMKVFHS
jgi:asparagine synthase (glutamine-hydrolysing)